LSRHTFLTFGTWTPFFPAVCTAMFMSALEKSGQNMVSSTSILRWNRLMPHAKFGMLAWSLCSRA
jgi:hypothetical protein